LPSSPTIKRPLTSGGSSCATPRRKNGCELEKLDDSQPIRPCGAGRLALIYRTGFRRRHPDNASREWAGRGRKPKRLRELERRNMMKPIELPAGGIDDAYPTQPDRHWCKGHLPGV
jgi:hypothetical protein